ncbi:MAG: phosphonate C-P lyase system protein PhnH [Mesorhizobium sp.]|uniref:phosphonate C-P lyase system protein PhnH n=1 Tax=Mesorhizobium sp. TaxID=1871066 RepID=UPI000FE4AF70|nr:phosphonate C-P lyase system protein PhnH [Mesorhizobium sp.]RWK47782.1 MAG: phosphonate C-P lyase system protein PhnH [Mesorhizobium sp.]
MPLSLAPTADDSRTNAAFEELMWALSRPGGIRTLPTGGLEMIGESLLDRECSFCVLDDLDIQQAVARTGARAVSLGDADYIFSKIDTGEKVAALSGMRLGTLAYPDDAATLFAPARLGAGQELRLTGPGIKTSVTIAIDGVAPSFWQMRERAIRYPLGFDVYLVDGDRVIGIPRSTTVEVL